MLRAIKSEWIFLQNIAWDTGDMFAGEEKMIRGTFLPRLFFRNTKTLSPVIGAIITMKVKKSRLGLLNPVTPSQEKYLISQRGSTELVQAVTGGGAFSNVNHLRTLSEEGRDGKKDRESAYESKINALVSNVKSTDKRLLLRAKITGAWLSLLGTTVSGTVLSST